MASKNQTRWRVASVALTLALALAGFAQPSRWLVVVVCLAIAGCIIFCLSGWAFDKRRTVAEKIGRGILLGLAAAAVSVLYGWQFWPTVQITPTHVVFDPTINNQSYIFILRNKTGDDVYSVESAFTLENAAGLHLDIPKDSRKPIVDGSEMADISAIKCRYISGNEFYLVSIHHLGPQEAREISFTNESQNNGISAHVSYFTQEPNPRINDPGKMQETFHPEPEVSCYGALMFWLDPARPPFKVDLKIEGKSAKSKTVTAAFSSLYLRNNPWAFRIHNGLGVQFGSTGMASRDIGACFSSLFGNFDGFLARFQAATGSFSSLFRRIGCFSCNIGLGLRDFGLPFYGKKQECRNHDVGQSERDHKPVSNFRSVVALLFGLSLVACGCTCFYWSASSYFSDRRSGLAIGFGLVLGAMLFCAGDMMSAICLTRLFS